MSNLPSSIDSRIAARLLGMPTSAFYRRFPAAAFPARGIVRMSALADALREAAVGIAGRIDVPPRLLTEEEVAPLFPMGLDGHPATVSQVRAFCRRRLFPVPHFDFGPKCKRFPEGAAEWWWSYLDSPVPVGSRVYRIGDAPYRPRVRRGRAV